jgi:hypothetical protein
MRRHGAFVGLVLEAKLATLNSGGCGKDILSRAAADSNCSRVDSRSTNLFSRLGVRSAQSNLYAAAHSLRFAASVK